MDDFQLLQLIRPQWLQHAVKVLAQNARIQEDFYDQINLFYDSLEQSVQHNDPSYLNDILGAWVRSQTQTDIEGRSGTIPQLINEITVLTYAVCREQLSPEQICQLSARLFPIFSSMMQSVASMEITAQVNRTEEHIAQLKQALQRVEKSKSDFISIASHELKTPLTLIEGYATMLNDQHHFDPQSNEYVALSGILKGTRRMQAVISDMTDVSLIDNNLLTLNLQPYSVNQLIKSMQAEFSKTLEERQQQLSIQDIPGGSDIIYFDVERLAQVFRNVIQNAIKFTPNGGKVFIEGRKLPGFIEVNIRDTGIGIDPDDQLNIFDKFGQLGSPSLHSSSKTGYKGGGPGLGLHIAKGIIEAHGGAIWVESPGCDEQTCPGSTFHIMVPTRRIYKIV